MLVHQRVPIKSMVIFHAYVSHNQRVVLFLWVSGASDPSDPEPRFFVCSSVFPTSKWPWRRVSATCCPRIPARSLPTAGWDSPEGRPFPTQSLGQHAGSNRLWGAKPWLNTPQTKPWMSHGDSYLANLGESCISNMPQYAPIL